MFLSKFVHGLWVNTEQVNNFLVQRWNKHIKATLHRLFFCRNMFVRSAPTLNKYFFVQCCLRRISTTLTTFNYLMLTYNGKQSRTKEASLLTFSLTKLLRIAVFNLEILAEIIDNYLKQQYSAGKTLLRIAVTQL